MIYLRRTLRLEVVEDGPGESYHAAEVKIVGSHKQRHNDHVQMNAVQGPFPSVKATVADAAKVRGAALMLFDPDPLRVIVAGSRGIEDYAVVKRAIETSGFVIGVVVSGCARGVDLLGERWAEENGVPIDRHPAKWHEGGLEAGLRRNERMAAVADALIAVWDGLSFGTAHMIREARKRGLQIHVERVRK